MTEAGVNHAPVRRDWSPPGFGRLHALQGGFLWCVFVLFVALAFAGRVYAKGFSEGAIRDRAEAYVRGLLPDYLEVDSIVWSGLHALPEVPERAELQFASLVRLTWFGPQRLAVDVTAKDERVKRMWLTFELRGKARVACASQAISRGRIVEAADVELQEISLSQVPSDFAVDPDALIGRKARRAFHKGQALPQRSFEHLPDVRKGDKVNVMLSQMSVRIETTGIAQEDGIVGEVIFVRNEGSGKTYLGRIIGQHRVEVNL